MPGNISQARGLLSRLTAHLKTLEETEQLIFQGEIHRAAIATTPVKSSTGARPLLPECINIANQALELLGANPEN